MGFFKIFPPKHGIISLPTLDFEEARRRARILVVDDDDEAFPVKLLRGEGYNIQYWEAVENLKDIEQGEYDIIVLDIHGVAPSLDKREGLAVLEHIKHYNPAQIIIAYSAKKYDLKQGKFWKLADDFLGKPATALECKQKIDDLIKTRFSKEYYWSVLKEELKKHDVPDRKISKLEKQIVKSIKSKEEIDIQKLTKSLSISKDLVSIITNIIGMIAKLAAL